MALHLCFVGMDISPIDLINIARFTDRVIALTDYRKSLHTYLQSKMHTIAPNMSALIGEQVRERTLKLLILLLYWKKNVSIANVS